jgi:hypothetical protein
VVVTSFPLKAILHNSNATGNIAKWATKLVEFQLDFQPRHAIKSQALADFIVEWTLFFDGSARQQGGGAGVVLIDPNGDQVKYIVHLEFKATNNMASMKL